MRGKRPTHPAPRTPHPAYTMTPLVALDLGSTKVACAIGLPHEQAPGFELLGSGLVNYPAISDVWFGDPLMVSRTIEQALGATGVAGEFHRALVSVNPPSLRSERAHVAITLGDEPVPVKAHDLRRLEDRALAQALGVDREPLLVERLTCAGNGFDGVRDPRGLAATRLVAAFHIVTMPIAARRVTVQAVESVGLEIARLSYSLPALLAGAAMDDVQHKRVLLVDVAGLTTSLGAFVEGALQACELVPGGGLTMATTVAGQCHVTLEQALAWTLEGAACRKPEVRALIDAQRDALGDAIARLLEHQPQPDLVLVSGRGALVDGFMEWLEQATGLAPLLCRSPAHATSLELSKQVGLSAAIGLLELATRASHATPRRTPNGLFDRLIDRTRTILTEYF